MNPTTGTIRLAIGYREASIYRHEYHDGRYVFQNGALLWPVYIPQTQLSTHSTSPHTVFNIAAVPACAPTQAAVQSNLADVIAQVKGNCLPSTA